MGTGGTAAECVTPSGTPCHAPVAQSAAEPVTAEDAPGGAALGLTGGGAGARLAAHPAPRIVTASATALTPTDVRMRRAMASSPNPGLDIHSRAWTSCRQGEASPAARQERQPARWKNSAGPR